MPDTPGFTLLNNGRCIRLEPYGTWLWGGWTFTGSALSTRRKKSYCNQKGQET